MDWEEILRRAPVGYGVVTYDYIAANDDELTLRKGNRVTIHSKDEAEVEDFGWWLGSIGSRVGVFPMNYLEEEETEADGAGPSAALDPELEDGAGMPANILFEIPYDKMKILKVIGSGGFGRVFLARYARKDVAVKLLSSSGMDEEELSEKAQELRAEGELIAMCSHINIAKVYGACTTPPNFCLVLEYARGGALSTVLAKTTLEPKVIVDFATQIARGMNYLHHESPLQVVHRDLKSSNILLAGAGQHGETILEGNIIKITDFGLARKFTQTTRMTTAGTFAWMAPEVIRTSSFSRGSDVWSYGVLLWELLTSQVPYHGIHMMTVAYSVALKGCTLPIPSLCPAPFESLMKDCWASESRARPTFTAILLTLQNARGEFSKTHNKSFKDLQSEWRLEMSMKFKELTKTEQEVMSQQKELERTQQQQQTKERVLDEKEKALQLRELQLQQRELLLLVGSPVQMPRPIKRNTHRLKSRFVRKKKHRINKKDIGAPVAFRHVAHVGSEGGQGATHALVPAGPNAAISPPRVSSAASATPSPSPVKVSPTKSTSADSGSSQRTITRGSRPGSLDPSLSSGQASPSGMEWACDRCSFRNHTSLPYCEMCEQAAPHVTPVPPPRDNPPSRRLSQALSPLPAGNGGGRAWLAGSGRSASFAGQQSGQPPASRRGMIRSTSFDVDVAHQRAPGGIDSGHSSPARSSKSSIGAADASPMRRPGSSDASPFRPGSTSASPFADLHQLPWVPNAQEFKFPPIPCTGDGQSLLRPRSPSKAEMLALSPTNPFSPGLSPQPSSPTLDPPTSPAGSATLTAAPSPAEHQAAAKSSRRRTKSPSLFGRTRAASDDVLDSSKSSSRKPILPMIRRRFSNPFRKERAGGDHDGDGTVSEEEVKPPVETPHWLQPALTRPEVLERLRGKTPGSFVIRSSQSKPGNFAISVVLPDSTLWNGLILRSPDQGWRLGTEGRVQFNSLTDLVRHFVAIPFTFTKDHTPCNLKLAPVPTPTMSRGLRPRSQSESRQTSVYDERVLTEEWEKRLLHNRSLDSVASHSDV